MRHLASLLLLGLCIENVNLRDEQLIPPSPSPSGYDPEFFVPGVFAQYLNGYTRKVLGTITTNHTHYASSCAQTITVAFLQKI